MRLRVNKELKESSTSLKYINKSNTEQINNKSGFYLSQQILNKNSKDQNNNFFETNINFQKSNINFNEENKNEIYYLISDVQDEKASDNLQKSLTDNIQIKEKQKNQGNITLFKIKQDFIPEYTQCFDFDLETMSYLPSYQSTFLYSFQK